MDEEVRQEEKCPDCAILDDGHKKHLVNYCDSKVRILTIN